jgi:hypothetical protein
MDSGAGPEEPDSVEEFNLDVEAFFVAGGAGDGPDGAGDATAAADDPTHVLLGGSHLGDDRFLTIANDLDFDARCVVDDLFGHVANDFVDNLTLFH